MSDAYEAAIAAAVIHEASDNLRCTALFSAFEAEAAKGGYSLADAMVAIAMLLASSLEQHDPQLREGALLAVNTLALLDWQ